MPTTIGQVIICKAAIAYGPSQPLVIEEVQVAPPQELEVRIQITHTSVCRSDLYFWEGKGPNPVYPRIFGHEAAGIVESVGDGVTDVQPGDHVLPLFHGECQACKYCKSDKTNLCQYFRVNPTATGVRTAKGHYETRFSMDGKPVYHCIGTSTFSQYTVVSHACVVKVNPVAALEKVCLLSCGVAAGLGAVWNSAKVHPGSTVAIFGLGTVGLAVAEGARVAGASRIVGIDVNADKAEKARRFGLTEFIHPNDHDKPIQQVIHELTEGGVDYAFECVGTTELMRAAYESTHDGWGVAVVMGVTSPVHHLSFPHKLLFSGRIVKGSTYGEFKGRSDLPGLVEKYLEKKFNLDDFVTHQIPLSRVNEAFDLMLTGQGLRTVIHLHDSS